VTLVVRGTTEPEGGIELLTTRSAGPVVVGGGVCPVWGEDDLAVDSSLAAPQLLVSVVAVLFDVTVADAVQ